MSFKTSQGDCLHIRSGMRCKICEPPAEKKSPKPLRKVSEKRKEQNSDYTFLRKTFLEIYPICEVLNCNNKSDQIHHMAGREGERLTDVNHFLAVCDTCHKYIEINPLWAKIQGYSESRLQV